MLLLLFCIFVLLPMIMGVVTSLFRYNMKGMTFIGFDNYVNMFKDDVWQKSLVNTLILVVGSVPITVLFALFVACSCTNLHVAYVVVRACRIKSLLPLDGI